MPQTNHSTLVLLVSAKHCGASLRKRHHVQSSLTWRGHSSLSVEESECEALVISEVGAIIAEELVVRIQSNQRRGPERLECHMIGCIVCVHTRRQGVPSDSSPVKCIPYPIHMDKPFLRKLSLEVRPSCGREPRLTDRFKLVLRLAQLA